jgi:hypothetical protein
LAISLEYLDFQESTYLAMFPEYLVFSIAESAWFSCISKMLALWKMLCSALFHQGLITLEQSFFRGFMS